MPDAIELHRAGGVMTMARGMAILVFLCGLPLTPCRSRGDVVFDMTMIGNPGNPADSTGFGSVPYTYEISTYEVTVAQYTEFLNAKASSDPYGLYNGSMQSGPLGPFILQSGTDGDYTYSVVSGKENQPVRLVSFYDGIRLANWLHNGQGNGDTETGSYDLSLGGARSPGATWIVPSVNEWYKAAYYDSVNDAYYMYPNGSDTVPAEPTDGTTPRETNFGDMPLWQGTVVFTSVGETYGQSPYGVRDMGGNVEEWTDNTVIMGGSFGSSESGLRKTHMDSADPSTEGDGFGFRVAYVIPEPSSVALLLLGSLGCLFGWLRQKWR